MKAISRSYMLWWALVCCCCRIEAQTYESNNVAVQTFVGSGFYGYYDGQGVLTMFYNPSSIVVDSSGNFFVLDSSNYRIRKVTPNGTVTTFAGGGQAGLPGYGTNVSLSAFSAGSMTIDHSDNLWIVNSYSYSTSTLLRIGTDGLALPITLNGVSQAQGICVDSQNSVYISGADNRIYRYRINGVLEVFAGSGNQGSVDGNGIFNSFYSPAALAADAADNIYVWDSNNYLIRLINQNRDVTTIAGAKGNSSNTDGVGTNAAFGQVLGMCADNSGNIILTCASGYYYSGGSCVRKMTASRHVTTIAGSFILSGYADGAGAQALFLGASGVCLSQGMIFVTDSSNQRIRNIAFDPTAEPVLPADLQLKTYPGLQINGTVGRTYRIESSADMSNWNPETTVLLPNSPHLWIDQNSVSGNKFYRAFLLP